MKIWLNTLLHAEFLFSDMEHLELKTASFKCRMNTNLFEEG